ncbi:MAG: hypothetical protein ABFD50_05265 [Smithella sp.]
MPYIMIIPQEENHIEWIEQLFKAYNIPADGKVSPVVPTKNLTEAYKVGVKTDTDILHYYEWLVKNAGDRDSAEVLNLILLQSRWHLILFEHILRMGHGYGLHRRLGTMKGYGMVPGTMGGDVYPFSYRGGKPVKMKEVEGIMKEYLRLTRNPNLKMGKITNVGTAFEAEIRTKNNVLVDKILIDKETGYARSAY